MDNVRLSDNLSCKIKAGLGALRDMGIDFEISHVSWGSLPCVVFNSVDGDNNVKANWYRGYIDAMFDSYGSVFGDDAVVALASSLGGI